jgi:hypothetical protein
MCFHLKKKKERISFEHVRHLDSYMCFAVLSQRVNYDRCTTRCAHFCVITCTVNFFRLEVVGFVIQGS